MRWFAVLLLFQTAVFAQLNWEQRAIEIKPSVTDTNAVARFKFKNVGEQAVTILSVKSSCGCTVASPDKQVYNAGEEGVITANFTFGEREGLQEKTILVQTTDPKESTPILTLRVPIPEIFEITPKSVMWNIGEENIPKTIAIKVIRQTPIHILSVKSTVPTFIAELREKKNGKEYEVEVTPKDTEHLGVVTLSIETDLSGGKQPTLHVYAMVKAK